MAQEATIARERNINPLNSERARRSGHTRADYIALYNAQKGGIRTLYARFEWESPRFQPLDESTVFYL